MMFMIFADATPNANSFMQFWLSLGLISSVVVNIVTIVMLASGRKQKREVSFTFEPASKTDFDKQKAHCTDRHAQLFSAIKKVEDAADSTIEKKVGKFDIMLESKVEAVRRELNEVGKKVAGLETATEFQNQTLAGVTVNINRILERLPRPHHES